MTRHAWSGGVLVLAITLASGAGCNAVAGIHDPLDPASEAGAGTSGGTSGGTANVDQFVGTWVTTAATQAVTGCPQARMAKPSITLTLMQSGPSEITGTNDIAPGCSLVLNVSGDTATLAPGQICHFASGADTLTYSYASTSTLTVTSGGSELDEHLIATVTSTLARGVTCNFDETAVFAKQ